MKDPLPKPLRGCSDQKAAPLTIGQRKNTDSLIILRFKPDSNPSGPVTVQASYCKVFGPDDWLQSFDTADPRDVVRITAFMFNVRPGCFTYVRHNLATYLLAKPPHKFRSAGFKCGSCQLSVRRAHMLGHELFDCGCAVAVLGKGTSDFTPFEWRKYRIAAIERELPIRTRMEGSTGKN